MLKRFASNCPPYRTLQCKEATINVSVADTDATRSQGLSGVQDLADDAGMLFIFPDNMFERHFHMRDCRFDIDALAIDDSGKIIHIAEMKMAEPTTLHHLPPCARVLEVKHGFCQRYDIGLGDIVQEL